MSSSATAGVSASSTALPTSSSANTTTNTNTVALNNLSTVVPTTAQANTTNVNQILSVNPSVTPVLTAGHQSWFKFRSERAQWLAFLGIVIAIVAFIFGAVYVVDTYKLARWTSEKDYQAYCQNLLSIGTTLPTDCVPIVHAELPPPPQHSKDFFRASIENIKRALRSFKSPVRWYRISLILLFGITDLVCPHFLRGGRRRRSRVHAWRVRLRILGNLVLVIPYTGQSLLKAMTTFRHDAKIDEPGDYISPAVSYLWGLYAMREIAITGNGSMLRLRLILVVFAHISVAYMADRMDAPFALVFHYWSLIVIFQPILLYEEQAHITDTQGRPLSDLQMISFYLLNWPMNRINSGAAGCRLVLSSVDVLTMKIMGHQRGHETASGFWTVKSICLRLAVYTVSFLFVKRTRDTPRRVTLEFQLEAND